MSSRKNKYPVNHIIGFILSIVMTLVAAWCAILSDLPVMWIIIAIMSLAVIQAFIQLFMFMHITERGATHAPWNMMFHAFVVAAIIISGSLLTMSFGFTHDHSEDHEETTHNEGHEGH